MRSCRLLDACLLGRIKFLSLFSSPSALHLFLHFENKNKKHHASIPVVYLVLVCMACAHIFSWSFMPRILYCICEALRARILMLYPHFVSLESLSRAITRQQEGRRNRETIRNQSRCSKTRASAFSKNK